MSEELIGGGDLGTATSENVKVSESFIEQPEVVETPEVQEQTEDINGIKNELYHTREKLRKAQEYNEFQRQAREQINQPDPFADIKTLEKDSVPYVEDVEKIVQYQLHQQKVQMEEQQVLQEVEKLGNEKAQADPMFNKRMDFAFEILELENRQMGGQEGAYQKSLRLARTADQKIKVLEFLSTQHPMYDQQELIKPVAEVNKNKEIIDAVKRNAEIPAMLNTVGSAGPTTKNIESMSPDEYKEFFQSVIKRL